MASLSVRARLTSPWPDVSEVTSMFVETPGVNGPDDTAAAPIAGAFPAVVVVSSQVVPATAWTDRPALLELFG